MTRWQKFGHEHWRIAGFLWLLALAAAALLVGFLADWIFIPEPAPTRHHDTNEIRQVPPGYWLGSLRPEGSKPAARTIFSKAANSPKPRQTSTTVTVFADSSDKTINSHSVPFSAVLAA